jgi:hypothetical protein
LSIDEVTTLESNHLNDWIHQLGIKRSAEAFWSTFYTQTITAMFFLLKNATLQRSLPQLQHED